MASILARKLSADTMASGIRSCALRKPDKAALRCGEAN
jgi:hypothetical protein